MQYLNSLITSWHFGNHYDMSIPVRNEQHCRMASRSTGLQQPQILAAVESPLTAINSAFAAVQKIPESRSALQSGCKVASKRQRMLLPVMAYHLLVQKKRNAGSNNTIITIHGRGVNKALVAEYKPLESQNATYTLLVSTRTHYNRTNLQQ